MCKEGQDFAGCFAKPFMEPTTVQAALLRQETAAIASLERENDALKCAAASRPSVGLVQLKEIADLIPAIIW